MHREKGKEGGGQSHNLSRVQESELVAVAEPPEKKGEKASIDYFEKMLDGPCPNHAFPAKHLYKDCSLVKKYL